LPGRAKTRLAPRLGEWGAARLQARLTLHALHTALAARCGAVELHGTPAISHEFFSYCERRYGIALKPQVGADLGERMYHALRRHRAAILIGTDCPALRPGDLQRAARSLQAGYDVVLAPAEDGGYVLIAARWPPPALFQGIAWGGPEVYRQTLERLSAGSYRWRALRRLWDVDRPEDLDRLRSLRFCAAPQRRARR
jgi:rSAM/selenodomain-associated transferase 1